MTRAALLVCIALASGCGSARRDGDLLTLVDFTPRSVELGDRCEILGEGFPSGKTAKVFLDGQRTRPGAGDDDWRIEVEGVATTPDRVEFVFTQGLLHRMGGDHSTFRGSVTVQFEAAAGGPSVTGRMDDIQIDFFPVTAHRFATSMGREKQAREFLAHAGMKLAPEPPLSGGLLVAQVETGSPADRAGMRDGDLVRRYGDLQVYTVADLVPRPGERWARLELERAGAPEAVVARVDLQRYEPGLPLDVTSAITLVVIAVIVLLLFMAPVAGIITWVERRVSARMQSRVGPNRVGPQGFLQWLADGVKSILKEDIVPEMADKTLFKIAPYFVFAGVALTFVVMPFGQFLIPADLDIGILYVVAVTALVTIGIMAGGWASNNKWSLLGGIRSAAQIVSYEIPAAVAIVCIVMMSGTLRMQGIIGAQGGAPWEWFMFRNPITFGLFFLYFTAALAEGNRTPFDLPEAESELVAGYSTEYSGMRYLFFFFAEWANVFVMCGIATALFLGGWQIPAVTPMEQQTSMPLQIVGALLFLLKSATLVFVVIWIRWTLPRIRIDQMMNLCWKYFVPLSFAAFLLTAVWIVLQIPPIVETIVSVAMFALGMAILIYFVARVRYNLRATRAEIHLNPFV